MRLWHRIVRDLKARHNVDAYVVSLVVFVFAFLGLFGDIVPDELRWAALLAGVGLLVYRITLPGESPAGAAAEFLHDRSVFDAEPLSTLFGNARDVRVFAPSAVNLLSASTCEILRTTVLSRRGGSVRVVVQDPSEEEAVRIASRQLDESVEFQVQALPAALEIALGRLGLMSHWKTTGTFEYRLFPYNPGYSLVLIDPDTPHGRVIVEIHAFQNPSTFSRMHLELTRERNERWYTYWVEQYNHLWDAARTAHSHASAEI